MVKKSSVGRKKLENSKKQSVSFTIRLTTRSRERLRAFSKSVGVNDSKVVKIALEEYLNKNDGIK